MDVLICSTDTKFVHLLLQNLNRCGFVVARHVAWSACCGPVSPNVEDEPDAIVADLCCPAPECWRGVESVRARFPGRPVLFLAHTWPGRALTERCRPGGVVRKPFSMQELLAALREVASGFWLK